MATEIIINATSHETRVALLENNAVAELYMEREKDKGIVGNIYKGTVKKILPGMQAAFVDIGLKKAGFLYAGDVEATDKLEDYDELMAEASVALEVGQEFEAEALARPQRGLEPLPIEGILKDGQDILVQVSREPIGSKGCRVTTYITLPARYLVFMPTVDHVGISRRITDEAERKRLRELVKKIKSPNVGYIVRTASEGKDIDEFISDMNFLQRLWLSIVEKAENSKAPTLLHSDLSLALRSIRDLFTNQVDRVVIDNEEQYKACRDFARTFLPGLEDRIELFQEKEPIFDAFGIEMEIERALGRKIWLKSGGSIIIDETEALVTIDVNTGRYVGKRNLEETILKTNLEAVNEIVYQLRLRNIGGIIIIDFIDMEKEESRERVFHALENALKSDRSRSNILKVSELGLVEMTRKRVRQSLSRTLCEPCHYCDGRGSIKSVSTVCYEVLREIRRAMGSVEKRKKILVTVHPAVADLLLNEEGDYLSQIEKDLRKSIVITADRDLHQEDYEVVSI